MWLLVAVVLITPHRNQRGALKMLPDGEGKRSYRKRIAINKYQDVSGARRRVSSDIFRHAIQFRCMITNILLNRKVTVSE